MEIIENILKIMNKKGITAYKLEQDIGIKQSTFSKWKSGSQPAADKIIKIINYFQVSPNEIFGYNEKDPEADPDQEHLTENEKEMIKYFRQLPEREQIKMIGRIEDKAGQYKEKNDK